MSGNACSKQIIGPSRADGVATVTFNRPEKHNALSMELQAAVPPLARVLDGERLGDHAPEGHPRYVGRVQLEVVEEPRHVIRQV